MPSIIIKEKDKTSAEKIQYDDYTVLIPGNCALASDSETAYSVTYANVNYTVENGSEFLFETYEALKAIIGKGADLDKNHVSYHMAKRLLNLGMKVLYVVVVAKEISTTFFTKFEDRGLYDLRFITAGGFEIDKDIADAMNLSAARRGDAVALFNIPEEYTIQDDDNQTKTTTKEIKTASDIIAFLDLLSNEKFNVGDIQETPLKYGCAFAGTFNIDSEVIGSGTDKGKVEYPAYFNYLACFASYIKSYADWYAFAGSVRGVSPFGNITIVSGNFGDADIAILQTRDLDSDSKGHSACNVIANIRPYGNIIWGNRTLHPITLDPETNTAGLRASNFLNIRHLCSDIKKTVYRACRRFTFEPNSDTLWVRFSNEITPLLEKMKADQGIRGYKLIQETISKKATLKATIRIIPIEAVEDFDITVELADSIEIAE